MLKLQTVREALGLSQVALDRRAKLTRGTINDIERGKNADPGLSLCLAIVDALRASGAKGVEVETLFRDGPKKAA